MRVGLILLLIAGVLMVTATKNHNYSHFVKHRARPREIRGFKPEYISTAIGFGKRGDNQKNNRYEKLLSIVQQSNPRGVPVELIFSKIKSNPILMGKFMQLLLDDQEDQPTMMSAPESERTIALL